MQVASKLHTQVLNVLREMFPVTPIKEEVPIRVNGRTLFVDIWVDYPYNILFEIQGEQHEKFVPFFHKTVSEFKDSVRRDRAKEAWAAEHRLPLIYVYEGDDISPEALQRKIDDAYRVIDSEFEDF